MEITTERKRILNGIIEKGGLFGRCARLYIDDNEKGHQFIIECFEQCHNELTNQYWGSELTNAIIRYVKKSLTLTLTDTKH